MPFASDYQRQSQYQRQDGEELIEIVSPRAGDIILDMGCGTGDTSALLAERVGPQGRVLGVDPDMDRIHLARQTHNHHKNLTFEQGSSFGFPGEGNETYDIVFCSNSLHWMSNKPEFFQRAFSSLKKNGKVASLHDSVIPSHIVKEIFVKLGSEEIMRKYLKIVFAEGREVIDHLLKIAGFQIVYNKVYEWRKPFDGVVEFAKFLERNSNNLPDFSKAIRSWNKDDIESLEKEIMENGKLSPSFVAQAVVAVK